jgi:Flp pilus assembly protein CpaB
MKRAIIIILLYLVGIATAAGVAAYCGWEYGKQYHVAHFAVPSYQYSYNGTVVLPLASPHRYQYDNRDY